MAAAHGAVVGAALGGDALQPLRLPEKAVAEVPAQVGDHEIGVVLDLGPQVVFAVGTHDQHEMGGVVGGEAQGKILVALGGNLDLECAENSSRKRAISSRTPDCSSGCGCPWDQLWQRGWK